MKNYPSGIQRWDSNPQPLIMSLYSHNHKTRALLLKQLEVIFTVDCIFLIRLNAP